MFKIKNLNKKFFSGVILSSFLASCNVGALGDKTINYELENTEDEVLFNKSEGNNFEEFLYFIGIVLIGCGGIMAYRYRKNILQFFKDSEHSNHVNNSRGRINIILPTEGRVLFDKNNRPFEIKEKKEAVEKNENGEEYATKKDFDHFYESISNESKRLHEERKTIKYKGKVYRSYLLFEALYSVVDERTVLLHGKNYIRYSHDTNGVYYGNSEKAEDGERLTKKRLEDYLFGANSVSCNFYKVTEEKASNFFISYPDIVEYHDNMLKNISADNF